MLITITKATYRRNSLLGAYSFRGKSWPSWQRAGRPSAVTITGSRTSLFYFSFFDGDAYGGVNHDDED